MHQRELLFSKLGRFSYQTFVTATKLCRTYRHEYIGLEHWLKVLVDEDSSDISLILNHYQANTQRISDSLTRILHTMPNSSYAVQDLSAQLETAVESGLVISQLSRSLQKDIRSIHILIGILQKPLLQRTLYRLSDEFKKIPILQDSDEYLSYLTQSAEHQEFDDINHSSLNNNSRDEFSTNQTSASSLLTQSPLTQWCIDLTQQAEEGKIDPVIGRSAELRQLIDILLRRRQNNPILVGEAGVGKTAIVEALARKIASGDVPPSLQGARLLCLDLGRMQAGASLRGEFESRLKSLIDAIIHSTTPIILFCDEAHTLVGAGGQAGTGDAVNLLKPMLARGSLRMVAATTWSEYKQFFEPDAALTRRFQYVLVSEPSEEDAVSMLRAIAQYFAHHHQVNIRESAIKAAVHLSLRHLPSRHLPDKAISLLDTACARVALSQHTQPKSIEIIEEKLMTLQTEMEGLHDDLKFGQQNDDSIFALSELLAEEEENLANLYQQLAQESQLIEELRDAEDQQPEKFIQLTQTLVNQQQDGTPLIHPWVDDQVIAEVLSDWTGIPAGKMLRDDLDNTLNAEHLLNSHIFDQPMAIKELSQAIRISRAGIQDHQRPLGVFMLSGPSGVGKTETAFALAESIYGGTHNLITFNMSEFQESHTVSTLKGAPPGYVGYGKGGKLTEAIRRKPYSVLLLDEFEKAHPDIHDAFYQVFDKGVMEDGEGRMISFHQCFILMTCNVGAIELEAAITENPDIQPEALRQILHEALSRVFPQPLLARMNIIPYMPLSAEAISQIVNKHLARLQTKLQSEIDISLHLEGDITGWVTQRIHAHPSRGRAVENLLHQTILPPISNEILQRKRDGQELTQIQLLVEDENLSISFG